MKANERSERFVLIEGVFPEAEAREILMNMFSTKLRFHEVRNLGAIERSGSPDDAAVERIGQLKESVRGILETLDAARTDNRKLVVSSTVQLSLADDHA